MVGTGRTIPVIRAVPVAACVTVAIVIAARVSAQGGHGDGAAGDHTHDPADRAPLGSVTIPQEWLERLERLHQEREPLSEATR